MNYNIFMIILIFVCKKDFRYAEKLNLIIRKLKSRKRCKYYESHLNN